jgi:hypothetical protein
MRVLIAAALLFAFVGSTLAQGLLPEPFSVERPVTVIEPPTGIPLTVEVQQLTFGYGYPTSVVSLTAILESRTIRPVPIAHIVLRVALGPTTDGMITFRMRPARAATGAPQILEPGGPRRPVIFRLAVEDPPPPPLPLRRAQRALATVEEMRGDDGFQIFANPDSRELLWEALGKPSPTRQ